MKTSFLALALLALLATSALARQTAKNGYSMTFDVPKVFFFSFLFYLL